ncbi:phage tail protein [Pasteurella multocida]
MTTLVDLLDDRFIEVLADKWSATGYDGLFLATTQESKKGLIKKSVELHRHKGTPWSVREVIRQLGFGEVEIDEGLKNRDYSANTFVNKIPSDERWAYYALKKVRDIAENRFSSLANADGYKHVGRCKSVEMLRKVLPSKHGQRILVDAYYEGGTTGGGEFVADLQDLTTADDGGSCFVVLNNTARWKRIFDDRVDVVDFGAKSDEDATIAFENAFKYAGEHKKIITSEASTYFINKPLFLSGVGGIELNGKLYAKMTPENKSKPIITWAENAITLTQSHNNFINLVMWLEPTGDAPAICLAGLKSTNLKIGETGCVQIYATTEQTEQQVDFKGVEVSSTAYNRFDIDVLSTLHITGKGRGWVNENVINAQRFRALKAGFRAGILIDGEYRHNHNLIRRGCLEGGQTINIENGSSNAIEDARFERNPKNPDELLTISFSENAFSNRIIASWVSSPEFTNTPYGVHYDMVKVTDMRRIHRVCYRFKRAILPCL